MKVRTVVGPVVAIQNHWATLDWRASPGFNQCRLPSKKAWKGQGVPRESQDMVSVLPSLGIWGPCFLSTVAVPRKPYCASDLMMGPVCGFSPPSSPGTDYNFSREEALQVLSVTAFCLMWLVCSIALCPAMFCFLGSHDLSHLLVRSWVILMGAVLSPA